MSTLLKLAVSTVVVAANVQADVIMPNFELDLEYRNTEQLEEIAEKDINVAFGIDAFTEHYRAHMWDIRNNYKHTPWEHEIVRYESLKYYNTVYKLILTELARCIFDIKGGMVEYTNNYDNILECKGGKKIEEYDRSNWNYVVFVNVLNRIIHKDNYEADKIEDDINEVISKLKTKYTNIAEQSLIEDAKGDIEVYIQSLRLGQYLHSLRQVYKQKASIEDEIQKLLNEQQSKQEIYRLSKRNCSWQVMSGKFGEAHMYPMSGAFGKTQYYFYIKYSGNDTGDNEIKGLHDDEIAGDMELGNLEPKELVSYKKGNLDTQKKVNEIMKESMKESFGDDEEYNKIRNLYFNHDDKLRKAMKKIRAKAERDEHINHYEKRVKKIYEMIHLVGTVLVSGLLDMSEKIKPAKDLPKGEKWKIKQNNSIINRMKRFVKTKLEDFYDAIKVEKEVMKKMTTKQLNEKITEAIEKYKEKSIS